MKFKRVMRLLALAVIITLASFLPVPITFYRKDNLPKYTIEKIDTKEDDTEKDNVKELF